MEINKMEQNPQWRADLKKVFESFQATYIEDAKDEAKMENADKDIAGDYENKRYEDFETYIFDHIAAFFEEGAQ